MKLILGAVIATSLILFIGILVISPVFFPKENKAQVMLSFNILDDTNLPNWCNELSNFLNSQNIKVRSLSQAGYLRNILLVLRHFQKVLMLEVKRMIM